MNRKKIIEKKFIHLILLFLCFFTTTVIAGANNFAWKPVPTGINDSGLSRMFIDPHDANRVWGANLGQGLWYSDDGGKNWSSVSETEDALYYAFVQSIAFHPTDPNTFVVQTTSRLLKTVDRGRSWVRLPATGLLFSGNFLTKGLQSHPTNGDIFYLASGEFGIFKTIDGGNSFIDITSSTFSTEMKAASGIIMHPNDPNTLIVTSRNGGVYKSIDAGNSWSELSGGTGVGTIKGVARYILSDFDPIQFSSVPTDFHRLYVSGYSSIGGSKQQFLCYNDSLMKNDWTCPVLDGESTVSFGLSFSPAADHSFMVPVVRGDFYYLMTFTASTAGITGTVGALINRFASVATYYKMQNTILIGGRLLIERSIDGGATVEDLAKLPGALNSFIAVHPLKSRYIAMSRYFSKNRGKKWQYFNGINRMTNYQGFSAIAFSQTRRHVCYGISYNYVDAIDEFYVSRDGCKSFDYVSGSDVTFSSTLVVDPVNDQTIYSGGTRSGVFKSIDGGFTWIQKINGFPTTNVWVEKLIIDSNSPETLYAALTGFGTSKGIYKTVDGGENWFAVVNGIAPDDVNKFWSRIGTVAMAPSDSNRLCALPGGGPTKSNVLYCSDNGGDSWNFVNNNLPKASWVSLIFHPEDSNIMWVTLHNLDTGGEGVYSTLDSGVTWSPINSGIERGGNFPLIYDIAVNKNGSKLYASALGRGLYQYKHVRKPHHPDEHERSHSDDDKRMDSEKRHHATEVKKRHKSKEDFDED